jgi:hypothetical protein
MQLLERIKRDQYGGALMFIIGLAAALESVHYRLGTLSRMGPGFFPGSVGVLLALTGIAIFATAKDDAGPSETQSKKEHRRPEWRGWFLISLSILSFIVLGTWGGLLPATFAIVFISALADRNNTWKDALLLSIAVQVVCIVVFWWLLQVQFPLFRWG